jgi:peptidoglycan/LPS O-acetylase OafA/YrhL
MRAGAGKRITIADRLAAADGHPLGFDYLRLTLALSVVAFHSFATTHDIVADHALWESPWRAPLRLLLPMFFALSGFLVAGSLVRSAGLIDFLVRRALRIGPALLTEIALSALVLGPLLTALPLRLYFSDRAFFVYFLNAVGDVHFGLPGLFLHNPRAGLVNGSLWTLPYEGLCYLVLAALAMVGAARRPRLMLGMAVALSLAFSLRAFANAAIVWAPPGSLLLLSFLAGLALFLNRDRVAMIGSLGALAGLATLVLLSFDRLMFLAALPLAYCTVCLGLTRPPRTIAVRGDYSYGVYLFAYPIQQACVLLLPGLRSVFGIFLIAAPLSLAYAAFSWRCIECPVLARKRWIVGWITRGRVESPAPARQAA